MGVAVTVGQGENGKDSTQWVRVTCFGEVAEEIAGRARKGDRLYIEGSLTLNTWNDAHGEVKTGLNVAAWRCERLGNIGRHRPKQRTVRDDSEYVPAGDGFRLTPPGTREVSASTFAGPGRRRDRGENFNDGLPF
jgi:single-stranded DNA-binding protein